MTDKKSKIENHKKFIAHYYVNESFENIFKTWNLHDPNENINPKNDTPDKNARKKLNIQKKSQNINNKLN